MSAGKKTFVAVVVGLCLFILALGALVGPAPTPSYADTVPTPAAAINSSDDALYVVFWDASARTADGGTGGRQLMRYELLDIQFVIDQGTVNTTTLKLQYSNDNTNWSDGPDIVTSNAADADGIVQHNNLGRYTRVYADVTNSNPITITVKAVAK